MIELLYDDFEKYLLVNKDEFELINDTINTKYDNLSSHNYSDINYDIYQGIGGDKKKIGYKVCRFAEKKNGKKSVLPRILVDLLKARKDTRKNSKHTWTSIH